MVCLPVPGILLSSFRILTFSTTGMLLGSSLTIPPMTRVVQLPFSRRKTVREEKKELKERVERKRARRERRRRERRKRRRRKERRKEERVKKAVAMMRRASRWFRLCSSLVLKRLLQLTRISGNTGMKLKTSNRNTTQNLSRSWKGL